jgi:hypothetical protein
MMKRWLYFALLLPVVASAAGNLGTVISREAGKCAAAWQREDYATIVAFMPGRVVRQRGGSASLQQEIKGHFAEARAWGAQSLETTAGHPSAPKQIDRWLVAVVPVTAVVHSAHLDLTQDTQALALSGDGGKRWSFLLLYGLTQAELNAWFPEFRGRVRVPAMPKPRVTFVY